LPATKENKEKQAKQLEQLAAAQKAAEEGIEEEMLVNRGFNFL
jgi:hypothetical protein